MTEKETILKKDYTLELPILSRRIPNIVTIIDDVLKSNQKNYPKSSHYPSSARVETKDGVVGACMRQQWYFWKGESPNFDISSLWKMDMGTAIHEWIDSKVSSDLLKDLFDGVYQEFTLEYKPDFMEHPVRGRIDNLIMSEKYGNFGLEIKSGYGANFTNPKFGILNNGPKDNHLLQALIYLYISKFSEEEKNEWMPFGEGEERPIPLPNLDFFVLFYLARDNAYRTFYVLDLLKPEELLETVGNIMSKETIEAIKDKSLVPVAVSTDKFFIYEDISFRNIIRSYALTEKYLEKDIRPPRDYYLNYRIATPDSRIDERKEKAFPIDDERVMIVNKRASDWRCSYCSMKIDCWILSEEEEESENQEN